MTDKTSELVLAIDSLSKRLDSNEVFAVDVILALSGNSLTYQGDVQEIDPRVKEAVERFRLSFGRNLYTRLSGNITPIFAAIEKGIGKGNMGVEFFKNISHGD